MKTKPPDHTAAIRDLLNYYIDDAQIPTRSVDSTAYLLQSRKFLAKLTCAGFLFLKKLDLLDDFCASFHP